MEMDSTYLFQTISRTTWGYLSFSDNTYSLIILELYLSSFF